MKRWGDMRTNTQYCPIRILHWWYLDMILIPWTVPRGSRILSCKHSCIRVALKTALDLRWNWACFAWIPVIVYFDKSKSKLRVQCRFSRCSCRRCFARCEDLNDLWWSQIPQFCVLRILKAWCQSAELCSNEIWFWISGNGFWSWETDSQTCPSSGLTCNDQNFKSWPHRK